MGPKVSALHWPFHCVQRATRSTQLQSLEWDRPVDTCGIACLSNSRRLSCRKKAAADYSAHTLTTSTRASKSVWDPSKATRNLAHALVTPEAPHSLSAQVASPYVPTESPAMRKPNLPVAVIQSTLVSRPTPPG